MEVWRIKTLRMADDIYYDGTFACRSIDRLEASLEEALTEAKARFEEDDNILEVSISREPATESFRQMEKTPNI